MNYLLNGIFEGNTMKYLNLSLKALTLLCLSVQVPTVSASDIELYVNHNVQTTEKPRVMIVFDTSGSMNWSVVNGNRCRRNGYEVECSNSRLSVAKAAIKGLIQDNPDIEYGLMRFRGSSGGYVLSGMGTSHSTILSKIEQISASGSTPVTETFYESYLYLTGQDLAYASGVNGRDKSIDNDYNYDSPFKPQKEDGVDVLRCDNSINMIIMTDGDPTDDEGADNAVKSLYKSKYGSNPTEKSGSYLNSLAKYMLNVDLYPATSNVTDIARTFTIGFGTGMSSNGKALLKQTATDGGGEYLLASTAAQLTEALKKTITKIRQINDTFTSPSVASSQSDRTQTLDAVYFAMFYPNTGPRWDGNIKKLKLSGEKLVDKNNDAAIDGEGNIKKTASTFWLKEGEAADGNVVGKGGVSARISAMASRKVYTDVGTAGSGGSMPVFSFDNVKTTLKASSVFSGYSDQQLANLVNWSAGIDINDEDLDNSKTDLRPAIFGDPLHSRPVAINYGDGDIRLLVGTNAGFVHMFKDSGTTDDISEEWAFIPSELFPILPELKNNVIPEVGEGKVYGMDLTPTIYIDDANDNGIIESGDKVWAFLGMRRGGSSYYALDISVADKPKLLWSNPINPTKSGYSLLGQTWSQPKVTFIDVAGYKNKPLLVFGAGYDIAKDANASATDTKGLGVFIADAESGELVASFTPGGGTVNFSGLSNSIPADIALLDSDYDGMTDRMYTADTGGNVWRIDMPSDSPNGSEPWTVIKIAALGGTGVTDRKFFYQPEVARTYFSKVTETTIDDNGSVSKQLSRRQTPYEAILIGSGNRTNPKNTSVDDQLFMIRDEKVLTQSFTLSSKPKVVTIDQLMDIKAKSFEDKSVDEFRTLEAEYAKNFVGWRYALGVSEKALAKPAVIGGVAYYTSFTPASDSNVSQCDINGGSGALYAFHLHYGAKIYDNLKFDVGNKVPSTPQLIFDKGEDDNSQFLLIGVGSGQDGSGVIKAKAISNNLVPIDENGDGKIDLSGDFVGLKTHRTYIYREADF